MDRIPGAHDETLRPDIQPARDPPQAAAESAGILGAHRRHAKRRFALRERARDAEARARVIPSRAYRRHRPAQGPAGTLRGRELPETIESGPLPRLDPGGTAHETRSLGDAPLRVPTYDTQHFAPRSRPHRDAPGAGGGLQWSECVVRINAISARQIGDAFLLDQMAQPRQQPHDAADDVAEQGLQLCAGGRRGFDEYRRALARRAVDPVERQCVQVRVQIRRTAKALDEGDGATGGFVTFDLGLPDEKRLDGAVDDAQRRCQQFRVHGEQAAQRYGERQHPLPHRHARQDAVYQVGRCLGHSSRAARRTDAAPLATERDQGVARAALAGQAQEAIGEYAAVEVGIEFVFDELRQAGAATTVVYFRGERRIVLPHQPVERCLFRAAALVLRRTCGDRLGRCPHRRLEDAIDRL